MSSVVFVLVCLRASMRVLYRSLPWYMYLQAEDLLKKLRALYQLKDAVVSRKIAELENAIDNVKKGGWDKDLSRPMLEANNLLDKVRRWFSSVGVKGHSFRKKKKKFG